MGLDMYLYKKSYVKNWEHKRERYAVTVMKDGQPVMALQPERVTYIVEEVAYWRKANQIHAWFVKHVQKGNDDGGTYLVQREDLEKLLVAIDEVLADQGKAKDVLPTREGFFFGSTDYDEDYFQDLTETQAKLTAILKEPDDLRESYEYHASW